MSIIVFKLITICSCITSFVYFRISAVRFTDDVQWNLSRCIQTVFFACIVQIQLALEPNINLVCISPDTTLCVFLSMYSSDTTCPQTLCSLHRKIYVSKCNKAKVHVQLIYILGFMLHINERSTGSRSTFEFPIWVNFSGPSLYCLAWTLGK